MKRSNVVSTVDINLFLCDFRDSFNIKKRVSMTKIISFSLLAFVVLALPAQAEEQILKRLNYDFTEPKSFSFGDKTDQSKTFVYREMLDNQETLRFEFHISEFPFKQTFSLPASHDESEKVLAKIKRDHKRKAINTEHLTHPEQSFELTVVETTPGVFATSYDVNRVKGLSATTLNDKSVVLLETLSQITNSGGSLSEDGSREYHGSQTKRGWEESIWSMM